MKGVYCIRNKVNDKKYIGQSVDVSARMSQQKYNLTRTTRNKRTTNRLLYADVQEYGIESFEFFVLNLLPDEATDSELKECESNWMTLLGTRSSTGGYNLRMDNSEGCHVHEETREIMRKQSFGESNPNFGNHWSDDQKSRMSEIAVSRHASGEFYNDEWKGKISKASSKFWAENPEKKATMAKKVKEKKQKYNFLQYTKSGEFVKRWSSVEDILSENPSWKWSPIYSVCNGYKKSYRGYVWKKELKI